MKQEHRSGARRRSVCLPGSRKSVVLAALVAAGLLIGGAGMALAQEPREGSPPPGGGSAESITGSVTAAALAAAMDIAPGDLKSASIGTSDSAGVGTADSSLGIPKFKVTGGTFAILATGLAESADDPNASESTTTVLTGLDNSQGNDLVQLSILLNVPTGFTCASFDFAFFSDEYPEFVGSSFNDGFIAEVAASTFTIVGNQIVAPNNIAFDPTDNTVVDVSSNLAFHPPALGYVAGHTATGTTYDGATDLLRAETTVVGGGTLTLIFSIMDVGDSQFDSAVFLDNFQFGTQGPSECVPGALPVPTPTPTPTPCPTGEKKNPSGCKAVGGISVDGELRALPLDTSSSSGTDAGLLATAIAGISALALTLIGAAWYTRRRWLH